MPDIPAMLEGNDAVRRQMVRTAKALRIADNPDAPAHDLGVVHLEDGREVRAHVIHAADAVITDGMSVALITRAKPPRQGEPALAGGMLDPGETTLQAALREGGKEEIQGLHLTGGKAIGARKFDRPYDIRWAYNDRLEKKYGVKKGDLFMVSTQAVRFDVPDLATLTLTAADDAKDVRLYRLAEIKQLGREGLGDHYDLIAEAIPEAFPSASRYSPKARASGPAASSRGS